MIYAIQAGQFVKIGYSGSPESRLAAIQTATPLLCNMLGVMAGTPSDEKFIHEMFSTENVRGEWFELSATLKSWIDENMISVEEMSKNLGGISIT